MGLFGPGLHYCEVLLVQCGSLRGAELPGSGGCSLKLRKTADCVAEKLQIRTLDIVMSLCDTPLCSNNRYRLWRAMIC